MNIATVSSVTPPVDIGSKKSEGLLSRSLVHRRA